MVAAESDTDTEKWYLSSQARQDSLSLKAGDACMTRGES